MRKYQIRYVDPYSRFELTAYDHFERVKQKAAEELARKIMDDMDWHMIQDPIRDRTELVGSFTIYEECPVELVERPPWAIREPWRKNETVVSPELKPISLSQMLNNRESERIDG